MKANLQEQNKVLSKQLDNALKLLVHQERHLKFLEGLIGKAVTKNQPKVNNNEELQKEIKQLLKENDENN